MHTCITYITCTLCLPGICCMVEGEAACITGECKRISTVEGIGKSQCSSGMAFSQQGFCEGKGGYVCTGRLCMTALSILIDLIVRQWCSYISYFHMFPNSDRLMTNPSNPLHPIHINQMSIMYQVYLQHLQHHKQWQDGKWLSGCNVQLFAPQDGQSGTEEEPPLFHHFVKGHQRVASLHVFCQYCNLTPMGPMVLNKHFYKYLLFQVERHLKI